MCSYFFFFKQKTAYEMRISDWSSDVCSSDLSEFRALDQCRELSPEFVRRGTQRQPSIGRGNHTIGTEQRMPIALGTRHQPGIGILIDDPFAGRQHAVHHADIDELALARAFALEPGPDDSAGGAHPRDRIADPSPHIERGIGTRAGEPTNP